MTLRCNSLHLGQQVQTDELVALTRSRVPFPHGIVIVNAFNYVGEKSRAITRRWLKKFLYAVEVYVQPEGNTYIVLGNSAIVSCDQMKKTHAIWQGKYPKYSRRFGRMQSNEVNLLPEITCQEVKRKEAKE